MQNGVVSTSACAPGQIAFLLLVPQGVNWVQERCLVGRIETEENPETDSGQRSDGERFKRNGHRPSKCVPHDERAGHAYEDPQNAAEQAQDDGLAQELGLYPCFRSYREA